MRYILFLFYFLPLILQAQEQTSVEIIEHGIDYDIIRIKVGGIKFKEINTHNGLEKKVLIDRGRNLLDKGAPDLPKLAFSLIVPDAKDGTIEILRSTSVEYLNIKVAPSKGKIYRNQNPDDIPYVYGEHYLQNRYYPSEQAYLFEPYILRDFRAQTLHINPVQYNAVAKKLKVYTEMYIKVSYDQNAENNIFQRLLEQPAVVDATFHELYKYHFLNYKTSSFGYTPLIQSGKLLILCDSKYANAMSDFIEWKNRKGFQVFFELSDTITGGATEANLKARVSQYYQQEQISYLLLVGDAPDIPPQNAYWTVPGLFGPSDLAYAYQSGNDHYPEFIVGRFSADTLQHVLTQVKRTLLYERQANNAGIWMRKQVAIGSDQGPGDKGEYDFEHLRGIADSNKNFGTYVFNYEFFDGSHGGNDAPGPPPVNSLRDAINDGIGLINYCGHGTVDMFVTSTFIGKDEMLNVTNNNGKWPFIFSTACQNGSFVYSTCLGENFLWADDGVGNPKGAIATIMSSINQSWDPPMHGQDEMNAILRGARPGIYQTTFGAITSSGIMGTNDFYNTTIDPHGGDEIADTWIVFGDPTVLLYTADNGQLNCSHNQTVGLNSTSFEVTSNEENSQIGLFYRGEYLSSAVVKNGKALFTFPPLQHLDTIYVTGTKMNFQPYYGMVSVINGAPFGLETLEKLNIYLYPNPANNTLYIKDVENKVMNILILDMQGRALLQTTSKIIDVSTLPSGLYEIALSLQNDRIVTKFLKK